MVALHLQKSQVSITVFVIEDRVLKNERFGNFVRLRDNIGKFSLVEEFWHWLGIVGERVFAVVTVEFIVYVVDGLLLKEELELDDIAVRLVRHDCR